MRRKVSFNSESFKLEGVLFAPDSEGPFPAAIVLHPHPEFGGSMNNNVVDAICERLESSMIALKFNCRGVGRSEGISSGGQNEAQDVLAAIEFLKADSRVEHSKLGFVGYSWGTYVGLPVTYKNPDIQVLIGIACPVGLWNYNYLLEAEKPKLLVAGAYDQFAPVAQIKRLFAQLLEPKEFLLLETDHFYGGQERPMANKVKEFLSKFL
jgi:alpha/beta superfamily hydrolase